MEDALGGSGSVSFRRISDESPKVSKSKLLFLLPPVLALAASLVWMLSFLPESKAGCEMQAGLGVDLQSVSELVDDPDSPIHGVTLEQLETFSGMPADGWSDPQVRELLLDRVDEGLIQRPGFSPGRKVRYHYLDETEWMHPSSNTRIISAPGRKSLFWLDLY